MSVAEVIPVPAEPVAPAALAVKKRAVSVETIGMTKRFGGFTALGDVSVRIGAGTVHALLGENGAGKSTLVKCIMGFYQPTGGQLLVDDREAVIASPRDAHERGLGMVYQHFTLIPSLTAAENLVISRPHVSAVINWRAEKRRLEEFMARMPFQIPLDRPVAELAAGQKQKLEILKQLYLESRFLILDEPTSVLTPQEAEEVLGLLKGMANAGDLTILMITHKFREVEAFAEDVSVLRRGQLTGHGRVTDLSRQEMAAMMIGSKTIAAVVQRVGEPDRDKPVLDLDGLAVVDRSGLRSTNIDALRVHSREVVGIAGVSGNGQKELAEALGGQLKPTAGRIAVDGVRYLGTRDETRSHQVRFIPEEPLKNACVPNMSVAENLSFRTFDEDGDRQVVWLRQGRIRALARSLVERFGVKTASIAAPVATLSGGNVQRAVLARELTGEVELLIVTNPCFGLDFTAVAEIRSQIIDARNRGAAVLLISEDLDEILELSDRILVMSEGRIVYETDRANADLGAIGQHMAGHH
ncbi:MAG: ABC transporter ATP-binding protein [Bauldia sp.]|nr:ABC transporter ATP-binding protein [Bauldia sp.]